MATQEEKRALCKRVCLRWCNNPRWHWPECHALRTDVLRPGVVLDGKFYSGPDSNCPHNLFAGITPESLRQAAPQRLSADVERRICEAAGLCSHCEEALADGVKCPLGEGCKNCVRISLIKSGRVMCPLTPAKWLPITVNGAASPLTQGSAEGG